MKSLFTYVKFLYSKMKALKKHPPVTFEYPFVNKHAHLFSKLSIANRFEDCSACYKCMDICFQNSIEISGEKFSEKIKKPLTTNGFEKLGTIDKFSVDYSSCINCGLCIEVCPTKSLSFDKKHFKAQKERRLLVVDLKKQTRPIITRFLN